MTAPDVGDEIKAYFSFGKSRAEKVKWSNLWFESGLNRAAMTSAEFAEFKEVCAVAGIPASEQLATLTKMSNMLDRYGDTGYGDKPDDMSRVAYWFQHVAPEQAPSATSVSASAAMEVLGCSGP